MANIFARSPYIIRIAESGQIGSKVELFLSNTTFSGTPQYTLSKLIPASNNVETLYDISAYIREYISFNYPQDMNNTAELNPTNERVNVRVKRYKLVGTTYTLLNTTDYIAFDGYTIYIQNYNYDLGDFGLDEGNYYYYPEVFSGLIRVTTLINSAARYTNLRTGVINSIGLATGTYDVPRLYDSNYSDGNKVEILNPAGAVQKTYYFYPLEECKYTPVIIDFVNKYGAWQREFFFKASNDTFSVENTEYNLLQNTVQVNNFGVPLYNIVKGQRQTFNTNGKSSIKVNTGWVDETWGEVLKQIMLSERILIDTYKPAKINTKSTELFKHINTKQINYSLDFEFTYDAINSVV
jgi:hypothetical protein